MKPRLWNRDYSLLIAGLLVSYVGDAFFSVGIVWLALTLTGNALIVGTLMACYSLPPILLGPFAGALVDSGNKRVLMIVGDGMRGLILLGLYVLLLLNALPVWLLFVCVVALSICDTLYRPALRVLVPQLVPDDQLPRANSFIQGSQQFAHILGASLAGVVVVQLGTQTTLLVDAVTFFVSAFVLYLVRFPSRLTQRVKSTARSVLTGTWEGLRYCFGNPVMASILVLAFGMNMVMSPVNVIFPVFSRDTLAAGAEGFGWLSGSIGAGMLLGNLLYGAVSKRLSSWVSTTLGLAIMVSAFLGLSMAGRLEFALPVAALLGAAVPFLQVPMLTQMQRAVPVGLQGRIFATFSTFSGAAVPLGAALAGTAMRVLAPPGLFRAAAAGMLLVYLILTVMRWMANPAQPAPVAAEK